jgi:Fe-S-cluster containining protein
MTREDLISLATAFRDAAAQDLEGATEVDQVHRATLRAHQRLNQLEQQLFTDYAVRVDCKAGCGICCHLAKIDVRAHEVFALVDWLNANFSAEQRAAVLARAQAHAAAVAGLSLEQHLRTVRPCPLLLDMRCSAHPARPGVCRIGHSTDVRICQQAHDHPDDLSAAGGAHPESKLAMNVAADGSTFAFIEAGLDKLTYDLGSALAEALGDPEAQARWECGEPAFSPAARAKQQT